MSVMKLCDTVQFSLAAKGEQSPYGFEQVAVEQSEPIRIGKISTPFMLHTITDNVDVDCPKLEIRRIIECPMNCETSEYSYPMPCERTAHRLLPAGTYDIIVCHQGVYPIRAGETLNVTFLVEPVNETFAAIWSK